MSVIRLGLVSILYLQNMQCPSANAQNIITFIIFIDCDIRV